MSDERETGTAFKVYVCPVCGDSIVHRLPSYFMPNLNHRHGNCVYVMVEVGSVKQITYDDGSRP